MSSKNNISLFYSHPDPSIREYYSICLRLVQSLRIKSEYQAGLDHINYDLKGLTSNYTINPALGEKSVENIKKWKYYQEVSGVYLDDSVRVRSLDIRDDTLVPFTEVFAHVINPAVEPIHPLTAMVYKAGTIELRDLLNKHTLLENAIMGTMYPCDVYKAMEAKDFTILSWDKTLVEEQEDNLIYELQDHINRFTTRWHNQFYTSDGAYYYSTMWANLIECLFLKVLNIRLDNCRTPMVHSFHLKQYLASNFELDKYMKFMTRKQIMFLYRNLGYIKNNSGKDIIFHLLKDRLLTDRNIPLSEVSIRHHAVFDDNYLADIYVRYKPINIIDDFRINYLPFSDLADKESVESSQNRQWYEHEYANDEQRFKLSNSSVVQTKALYSMVMDYQDSDIYPLSQVLVNHWGHWARTGHYTKQSSVLFTDPRDSSVYSLSPMETFVLFGIFSMARAGLIPTNFGKFISQRVLRFYPSNTTSKAAIRTSLINLGVKTREARGHADNLIAIYESKMGPLGVGAVLPVFTYVDMYSDAKKVFDFHNKALSYVMNIGDSRERSSAHNMLRYFFMNKVHTVSTLGTTGSNSDIFPYSSVQQFLDSKGFSTDLDLGAELYEEILEGLLKAASGYYIPEELKIGNIQKAMVAVFKTLCSYTVKFITETNDTKLLPLWASPPLLTNVKAKGFAKSNGDTSHLFAYVVPGTDDYGGFNHKAVSYLQTVKPSSAAHLSTYPKEVDGQTFIPSSAKMSILHVTGRVDKPITVGRIDLLGLSATTEYAQRLSDVSDNTFIVGKEFYLSLSDEDKASILV